MQECLDGVQVEGNWLPEGSGLVKATARSAMAGAYGRIDVEVGTRAYGSYTSSVCEVKVWLRGRMEAKYDLDAAKAAGIYDRMMDMLEEWQGSLAAAKEALRLEDFEPSGFRLDGGDWEIDGETKDRTFTQGFTVKGLTTNKKGTSE